MFLATHTEKSIIFRDAYSAIQNDLSAEISLIFIKNKIEQRDFVAHIIERIYDTHKSQFSTVFHYIKKKRM